jgi:hypothetical protein
VRTLARRAIASVSVGPNVMLPQFGVRDRAFVLKGQTPRMGTGPMRASASATATHMKPGGRERGYDIFSLTLKIESSCWASPLTMCLPTSSSLNCCNARRLGLRKVRTPVFAQTQAPPPVLSSFGQQEARCSVGGMVMPTE